MVRMASEYFAPATDFFPALLRLQPGARKLFDRGKKSMVTTRNVRIYRYASINKIDIHTE